MGILEKGRRLFAHDGFCFFVGCRMGFQGIHLYEEGDIFSLFYDLLHLLMKFSTVRSVRIVKNNDPNSRLRVTHHDGIFERDLGNIDLIEFSESLLGQILLILY